MLVNNRPAYICLNLFRLDLFKKYDITFPEGREFEDIITKVKLLYYSKRVAFTDDKLYYYLMRNESITNNRITTRRCQDFMDSVSDVSNFLHKVTSVNRFTYLSFYELCSLMTLLNYLAREDKPTNDMKLNWKVVRGKLLSIYPKTLFPSARSKLVSKMRLMLSANMPFYSSVYKVKKGIAK